MAGDDEDIVEDGEFDGDTEEDVEPDEIDEESLEDEELAEDDEFGGLSDDEDDLGDDDEEEEEEEEPAAPRRAVANDEDDDDEDLVTPDDVEADLDTILKDRLVAAEEAGDEDEEEVEVETGDPGDRIQPRRPGEFVCQSCFLLKPRGQLADESAMLCLDCV